MTTQLPNKEKVQWLHDTATEFAAVDMKLTLNPAELLPFTSALLAAHEQEPVAWIIEDEVNGVPQHISSVKEYALAYPERKVTPLYTNPAPVSAVPELVSIIGELTSAIRSINRAPHHIAKGVDDDEPCYWQRKEWIDWILELASSADEKSRAAMLNGGKS